MRFISFVFIFFFLSPAFADHGAMQDNPAQVQEAAADSGASSAALFPGLLIDREGIDLSSGTLQVPIVPGADAAEGPAAGPGLPPTPPNAAMARPEEAVP